MYKRILEKRLKELAKQFPVLAIYGPRQSGKTTLAKKLFPNYRYVNLESFDEQEYVRKDPKGFLKRFENDEGVILDEIQKAPKILSQVQIDVDERDEPGRYIVTSSHNILLSQHLSQTLAGRVALTTLLPLAIRELAEADLLPETFEELIFHGGYPRVYKGSLDPVVFTESYIRTYVERDVRDISQVTSLLDFWKFMCICAERIGQLLDIASLANDAGITVNTAKSWLSILEMSYVIFFLQPHHANFNKRIIKKSKLYFTDTALACHLLRINSVDDLEFHYLRGGLFESLVISDFIKQKYNIAFPNNNYFWRDRSGHEIDCLQEEGGKLLPIEIKSTSTLNSSLFESLSKWCTLACVPKTTARLIYGGTESMERQNIQVISWKDL